MERNLLPQFAADLKRLGRAGVGTDMFCLGRDSTYSLHYTPFEYINRSARLVLVGITPGSTQLDMAYAAAQTLLLQDKPLDVVAHNIKKHGAFGGPSMRPNLLRMLKHFEFEKLLKIDSVESLWAANAELLHSTSVVPHAAFKKQGKKTKNFAGSFADIQASPLLNNCFLECFVPTLQELPRSAIFVGLGTCSQAALDWCVQRGHIGSDQVLGSLCHPSTNGGSTVKVYLQETQVEQLKANDPVRNRVTWLNSAYLQMRRNVDLRLQRG